MIKEDLQIILSVIEDIEVILDAEVEPIRSGIYVTLDKESMIRCGLNATLDGLLKVYGMNAPQIDWSLPYLKFDSYPERLAAIKRFIVELVESAERKNKSNGQTKAA